MLGLLKFIQLLTMRARVYVEYVSYRGITVCDLVWVCIGVDWKYMRQLYYRVRHL